MEARPLQSHPRDTTRAPGTRPFASLRVTTFAFCHAERSEASRRGAVHERVVSRKQLGTSHVTPAEAGI